MLFILLYIHNSIDVNIEEPCTLHQFPHCTLHPPSHLHDVDGPVTVHVVHPEGPLELLLRRALRRR